MKNTFGLLAKLSLILIFSFFLISAHAATYSYASSGLSYTINDTNPLLAKATFSDQDFNFSGGSDSSYCNGQYPCHITFIVDSISDAHIPAQGPLGLSVAADGRATSIYSGSPVFVLIAGSYSYDYLKFGQTISISKDFSISAPVNISNPVIDVWDFPNFSPLIRGYEAAFSIGIINFSDNWRSCTDVGASGDCTGVDVYSVSFSALVGGVVDAEGARSYVSASAYSSVEHVPLPAGALLFGSSLAGLVGIAFRRRAS